MFRLRFIGFIFLVIGTMLSLGCWVLYNGENMLVRRLDAIILTADDLPTMEVDAVTSNGSGGVRKEPPVVDGFRQSWNGTQPEEHIYVDYWLFQTVADAQKAAAAWRNFIAAAAVEINGKIESAYYPEPNAEDVIGDATWHPANDASIWFA